MHVGAFVCSCGDTCSLDLEGVRDGIRDVEVVGSSSLLCEDGLAGIDHLVDEYDLDHLVITASDQRCRRTFRSLAEENGLHPDATVFVDHREAAGWIHDEAAATDKTARLVNAAVAGLREESVSRTVSRTVSREVGDSVAVVGDAQTAAALADTADVTLVADGREFADSDADLSAVAVERGQVADVTGRYGEFELTLRSRVTDDCISCLECVRQGPAGMLTRYPVDIHPDAPDGEWVDCCPTDAIDLTGVERTLEFDQLVYPGVSGSARGGVLGFHTGTVDAEIVASVERLLGGVEKPAHLDFEMDVCASGESSQQGCTACVDACPHEAVSKPSIDDVEFDSVACQNCGACTSSCPTGAVSLREPSNRRLAREVEALLATDGDDGGLLSRTDRSGIETPVVAFVCDERAKSALETYGRRARSDGDFSYPPILPVSVNCTDTVGEAHAVHALAAGADGVAIVGCGESCLHAGPDPKAALVDRLNRATTDLGIDERVAFFAPDPADHESFVDDLSAFVDGLAPSPVPAGDYEATGESRGRRPPFNSHDWTLESVRTILDHATPEREVIRGLKDFGVMEVDDACNLTPTCSTLCPTDAIRRTDDGELQFAHEDCVNCGLCEQGCPETAIQMRDGLDLSRLPENRDGRVWETVFEGEMMECARCGDPFTSVGSVETVMEEVGDLVEGVAPDGDGSIFEYCGDCRAKLLFEQGGRR